MSAHLGNFDDSGSFNDPASWVVASYLDDPIDHIAPLEFGPNPYRERALGCLAVVKAIDQFMSQASNSRLAWVGISIGLGLDSTSYGLLTRKDR